MHGANWLFYVGSAVASLIGALLGSFFKRLGEDFAAQQSIQKLTATVENIKAAISDDVWDRQKQWELRRDAVLDAIRARADLEAALVNLNSWLSASEKTPTDKADAELSAASQGFRSSRTSFRRAHLIADLAVGGQFSNAMSAYFLLTGAVVRDMTRQRAFLDSAKSKELALSGNNVILSARQALGIKDAGELPLLDDSNGQLTPDH
jgi:hypothetical protein